MSPPVEAFHPRQLQDQIQHKPNGKPMKPPVKLEDCQLREMMQFECDIMGDRNDNNSGIRCDPVLRLFRQCANGLTVEVTSYEGVHDNKD